MKILKLYHCAIIWRHAGYRIQTDPSPHPSPLGSLSSVRFTNSVGICGNGFWVQTRRERRAYPSAVCKERTTKSEPKRHAARRVAPHLAFGFVAPRSQIAADMLPRRAAPKAKCGATNAHPICEQHTRLPPLPRRKPGPELVSWSWPGVWIYPSRARGSGSKKTRIAFVPG